MEIIMLTAKEFVDKKDDDKVIFCEVCEKLASQNPSVKA
jgi:hypothetical protein